MQVGPAEADAHRVPSLVGPHLRGSDSGLCTQTRGTAAPREDRPLRGSFRSHCGHGGQGQGALCHKDNLPWAPGSCAIVHSLAFLAHGNPGPM